MQPKIQNNTEFALFAVIITVVTAVLESIKWAAVLKIRPACGKANALRLTTGEKLQQQPLRLLKQSSRMDGA